MRILALALIASLSVPAMADAQRRAVQVAQTCLQKAEGHGECRHLGH